MCLRRELCSRLTSEEASVPGPRNEILTGQASVGSCWERGTEGSDAEKAGAPRRERKSPEAQQRLYAQLPTGRC